MTVHRPAALAARAVSSSAMRPASAIVHDSPGVRAVVFRIEPGQQITPHTSPSTVVLSVVAGSGFVSGNEGERAVGAGDFIAWAPNERHGMRAVDEQLVVLAVIAPRPGTTG